MPDLKYLQDVSVDGFLQVGNEEAIECTRRLGKEEALFSGFSSGANLAGAIRLLSGDMAGRTIVILLPDSGLKYLSTDLWE